MSAEAVKEVGRRVLGGGKIAIVVLNYKTAELTTECLESLEPEIDEALHVLVVDNDSPDGSADVIEAEIRSRGWSSWARLIRSPVNGGFAAGNNIGIRAVEADTYVLLNSDTIVLPGAISSLREALERFGDAGLIAPMLLNREGRQDENTFRFPHPLTELLRAARTGPISRLLSPWVTVLPMGESTGEPDWVGFACVAVRREVIEQVGLLDEGFFMYYEDIDYCRRVRAAGWKILFWPESRIIHLQGASSTINSSHTLRRRAPRFYYEARSRYYTKYHGLTGLWVANALWNLGRLVSLSRESVGHKEPHLREGEWRDIWINAMTLRRRSSMRFES